MQNDNGKQKNDLKYCSYRYAIDIIKFIESLDNKNITTKIVSKQIIRSTTSIGANIIEAQAGSSKKDFTNFFTHALKSANETKFWLAILRDTQKVGKDQIDPLLKEVTELANILGSSILTLRNK